MSRRLSIVVGALVLILAGGGAAVFFSSATSARTSYALVNAVQEGQAIRKDNLRPVEIRTTEPERLIGFDVVQGWLNDGYVAAHFIEAGSWLRSGDFEPRVDTPDGFIRIRLPFTPPPGAWIGDDIRLYTRGATLGRHPFPCMPNVDQVVAVARKTGIRSAGWTAAHIVAAGAQLPDGDPSELNPDGWDYYRAAVHAGLAGLAADDEIGGFYLYDGRGLNAYRPFLHLAEHYDELCGTVKFRIVWARQAREGVAAFTEILTPIEYIPALREAIDAGDLIAMLPTPGSENVYPDADVAANLHAPLVARPLPETVIARVDALNNANGEDVPPDTPEGGGDDQGTG